MAIRWYLCSTPLHLFTAFALADNLFKEDQNHLVLIDQIDIEHNDYFELIQLLSASPFLSQHIFPGRIRGTLNKLRSRRQVAMELKQLVTTQTPDYIFTGNDRRIEFQTAMHLARKINPNCTGAYMDEGTFTYTGRKASSSFNDRFVDNTLKKLVYGTWWENPATVGASHWIKQVYAAFPEHVVVPLKHKECIKIEPHYYQSPAPSELANHLLKRYQVDAAIVQTIDVLITPPHESIFQNNPEIKNKFQQYIQQQCSNNSLVAVKYHPRDHLDNWLAQDTTQTLLLPKRVNFESILPLLSTQCVIIGDISSTLLNSRWMRPDLKVIALKTTEEEHPFQQLLKQLEVTIY